MRRAGIVFTIFFALLAFVVGFGGVTAALQITQPAIAGSSSTVEFEVKPGESTASVAQRLEQQGLVRNALFTRLWARFRKLDTGIEPGVYQLSPSLTAEQIMRKLQSGSPPQQRVAIPPGLRVTQYADRFKALPNFDAKKFLDIVTTGKFSDGTAISSKYWFVPAPQPNTHFALEGYLYPDTYFFNTSDNQDQVVQRLLSEFMQRFCPGPASNPGAYVMDAAACKQNAVKVGKDKPVNVFQALEERYFTTDDRAAIYQAVTLSSIVMREVSNPQEIQNVTNVYYNRYLVYLKKLPPPSNVDVVDFLGGDPTAQYARDTESPPTDPTKWWAPLNDAASKIAVNNLYNTNVATHKGLPPGPISAPDWIHLVAAADPNPSGPTPYFYFLSDKCGREHYAETYAKFQPMIDQFITSQNYSC